MEKKFWLFIQGAALAVAAGLVIMLSFYMASFLLAMFFVLVGMSTLINGVWYLYKKYYASGNTASIKFDKPIHKKQSHSEIIDAEYEIVNDDKKHEN